jgi:hypothetical protein
MIICDAKMDVTYHINLSTILISKHYFCKKNLFFSFISMHLLEWYIIANVNVDANMTNYQNLPLGRLRYRFFIF